MTSEMIETRKRKPRIRKRKRLSKGQRKLARRQAYDYVRYHSWNIKTPEGCDCDPPPRFEYHLCARCGGCWDIARGCKAACACFGSGADAVEFVKEFKNIGDWGFLLYEPRSIAARRCFMCGSGSTRTLPFIGYYNSLRAYHRANRRERICMDLQACGRREASHATPYKLMLIVKHKRRLRWLRGLPPNDNFNFADAFGTSSDRLKMGDLDKALAHCKANPQLRQTLWVIKPAWDEFEPYSLYLCAACPLKPPDGACPLASGERQGQLAECLEPIRGESEGVHADVQ